MQKKDHDHFIGLWRHPKGGWEIRYQLNGKKQSEYRKDKHEAELRAEYWKATLSGPPQESEEEHPVYYWERILRRVAELALANPNNKEIAATCRSLASAAQAAMRTAKYIPAPREVAPDSAPITGDISNMSTEEMKKLVDTNTPGQD